MLTNLWRRHRPHQPCLVVVRSSGSRPVARDVTLGSAQEPNPRTVIDDELGYHVHNTAFPSALDNAHQGLGKFVLSTQRVAGRE